MLTSTARPWRLQRALACATLVLLLLGCGRLGAAPAAPDTGGTLRVGLPADVVTLDPPMFTDVYSGFVSGQIHEPLFVVDFDQRIVPWLAETLEQPDASTYLITLRRGVKFQNSQELTADDVKFTFERVMDPATASPRAWRLTDAIESPARIEVMDRYTIRITLKQPFAPFLERLTQPSSFILNREAVQAAGAAYARQPVGTGPFKLVEQKSGEQIVLERNPDYWGEKPRIERLVFRPILDSQTRLADVESGGIDLGLMVPPEELGRLQAEGKVQVLTGESISVFYLGYNTRREPLTNPALRQAINFAIDREQMLARLYEGVGQVAYSALNPSSWAFAADAEQYAYDPAKARERLQVAGGPPDQALELVYNQTPEVGRAAERIQAQLKDNLGLKLVLRPMEFGAMLNYLKGGADHQLFLLSWSGSADPDGILFPLFHSQNFGAAGNRAFYRNDRVDALLSGAQRTVDQDARRAMYVEAQDLIMADAPFLPLRQGVVSAALRLHVHGYRLHPLQNQVYTSVTVQ